jgi:hypothetical protein
VKKPAPALAPVTQPELLVPFALGASSIATLLLYFYGVTEMAFAVWALLVPAAILLALIALWAKRTNRTELFTRIAAGLWAGGFATLAYDLVRVPIAMSGVPVFKGISYFGTVILGQGSSTWGSEVVGWGYHLSNGIGFALMYATLLGKPRLWTAVLWGLFLEFAMLLTPYAEVFGYKVSREFLGITMASHATYGATLWAALRYYWMGEEGFSGPRFSWLKVGALFAVVPFGIGCVAADFHARHASTIPPSPPKYLGPHLYVTWNVPEPDRFAVMWVFRRFSDPSARFHFIEPFSQASYGTPFDTPEAELRRSATGSATEVLIALLDTESDEKLALLGRVGHIYEISPWMRPTDPTAYGLGQQIVDAGDCGERLTSACVARAFEYLDRWYEGGD